MEVLYVYQGEEKCNAKKCGRCATCCGEQTLKRNEITVVRSVKVRRSNMQITTSSRYYHGFDDCPLRTCERQYCAIHRLLYRTCDTAVLEDGRWYEGDCPIHNNEARRRSYVGSR